eukprot:scaffold110375_cov17-Tisochrysis_lutea.AAC.1
MPSSAAAGQLCWNRPTMSPLTTCTDGVCVHWESGCFLACHGLMQVGVCDRKTWKAMQAQKTRRVAVSLPVMARCRLAWVFRRLRRLRGTVPLPSQMALCAEGGGIRHRNSYTVQPCITVTKLVRVGCWDQTQGQSLGKTGSEVHAGIVHRGSHWVRQGKGENKGTGISHR